MQPWPLAMLAGWPLVRGSLYEKMLIYIYIYIYICAHITDVFRLEKSFLSWHAL